MDSKISRRDLLTKASDIGAGLAIGATATAHAATTGVTIGSSVKTADYTKEKHVPVVDLPDGIKAGVPFILTASVGKDVPHPNTTEHFIGWIALYFKADDGGPSTELAKFEFTSHGESALGPNKGATYSDPFGIAKVRLAKSGTIIAVSYCNIHGLWESSTHVTVA